MQRPRRTSEFHEEAGGIRRQSRAQKSIAPSPSTASKFVTRQSRIALPTRPSSTDRGTGSSNNAFLTVPSTTGRTSISTPMSTTKITSNRVLFTAEKHRGGTTASGNGSALHNDKKWVQEQTQRITEYLMNQNSIGGQSTDFLQKGLRQMSIKQFVAIVNFFLNHIWGKRYVVGNNHVEDIIQILQKLQYPHPVNKSWLKTPNTQHSFGNVIVLFDFLMDFVPPYVDDDVMPQVVDYFELQEPHEVMNGSRMAEDIFQSPDLEFQRELLMNTEEGFTLWDTQMNDEFNSLQQETCNLLIKKTCNFPDAAAIQAEIEKLSAQLKSLEDMKPKEDKELIRLEAKLTDEFDFLSNDMEELKKDFHTKRLTQQQLTREKADVLNEVENMEREVSDLQQIINRQVCTVEQRNQLMTDQKHLEHLLCIEERTLRDLESRNHNQQVLYARVLKQFTDRVESFNAFMREIAFSNIPEMKKISSEELQLPLRPDEQQLQKLIPQLTQIREATQKAIKQKKQEATEIQHRAKDIIDEVDTQLQTKLSSLRHRFTQATEKFEKMCQKMKEHAANLNMKAQDLQSQLLTVDKNIEQMQGVIEQKRKEIEEMKEKNEKTMKDAEERHAKYLEQRRTFIKAYDEMFEQTVSGDVLKKLTEQVQQQEKELEALRNEFQSSEIVQLE
ncbi:kinetochore protein Ndc80 [Musca autumnalis]|uniref:kinetochore protein Ndc80 n=1 Tax=Musca autumnalis TaxID=221902 RepID=UPI003CF29DC8